MRSFTRAAMLLAGTIVGHAHAAPPTNGGPYNAHFLSGGVGIVRDLAAGDRIVAADAPFTLAAWVRPDARQAGPVELVTLGDGTAKRALYLRDGVLAYADAATGVASRAALTPGEWHHVAATSDGRTVRLFVDGRQVAGGAAPSTAVPAKIAIAGVTPGAPHFGGTLVEARVDDAALDIAALAKTRPDFDTVQLWQVGVGWEFQKTANTGYWRPQDPWTLPQSRGDASAPVAKPLRAEPALEAVGDLRWIVHGWRLAGAPDVAQGGAVLSRPAYDARKWHAATVPGTVLTTLVDRGVYPDPYIGLNNLAIPERLARQDWWYRTSFTAPAGAAGKRTTIQFGGINYASEVWVNGAKVGTTIGAFVRGRFDLPLVAGENVIAVKVSPPPHPGTPHEQSIAAGVGENGGQLAIDGPTFVATEGWDWIPGIRDRNTGLWLPVELEAHGDLMIGDPQIVTDLPLPRIDSADIHIRVPVSNGGTTARQATVVAGFDGVEVRRTVTVAPGASTIVAFTPATDPALRVANPTLWWPNGYGDPALHDMTITVADEAGVSDTHRTRFGIREVSYDLSLFDAAGALRRVNVQTTDGGLSGNRLIDVRHEAIKQTPTGWAESLTAAGETSPGVTPIAETLPEPHLTIRVNGVRIAARGGNWGMDDAMKRSDRTRLEPYFRLQRDAHMNIIRNWMGTNTEPQFYDLADEYGMMVMNDFWQSTQNFQVEPQDPQRFLNNARDTIARYRNHPSIILWFGRNEGVPYPTLNEGLDDAVFELDGTRWFTGSSNVVNLQGSGPYNYRPPSGYFTDLATGFSVETGTPSLSTIESIRSYVPAADQWPLSDTLAYHDWHFGGNGDTKTFMTTLATMFGPGTSLPDFERKAQMMNLETHKAMYEGFLGHLWTKNSGRLLWMTHPAWPSNAWQLYSWDYDTSAAYYGAKKAAEPVHVQLNLPGNELVVLNTTQADMRGLTATARVVGLDNRELFRRSLPVDALANRATPLPAVPLDTLYPADGMVLVALTLTDAGGRVVADNFYWRGRDTASYRALNTLAPAKLAVTRAAPVVDGTDRKMAVTIANDGPVAAINTRLTLVGPDGQRILPAYYSDNYVALLPGERRTIEIRWPATVRAAPGVRLSGWNVAERMVR